MNNYKILVINSGSSSVKYRLFDIRPHHKKNESFYQLLEKGLIEKIGQKGSAVKNHKEGIRLLLQKLVTGDKAPLASLAEISAIGHRVVHGGVQFKRPTVINKVVVDKIKECIALAPLHNPANLAGILACQELLPRVTQVAVFDTAFHQSLPPHAYIYGLPYEYYEKYGLRKFGFHGTSHHYVAQEASKILKRSLHTLNLITCHLGNGCSITAIKNGKSVDTSMGFTPLEGLVMGTRCGDIDPASVIFLSEKEKISLPEIDRMLNTRSGLMGISGLTNDMREIKRAARRGHRRARLALDIYTTRIKKYIGAYAALLERVDALVFTAGIGENEKDIRTRITKGLFGLLNRRTTKVLVIPTNEELMIAKQSFHLLNA